MLKSNEQIETSRKRREGGGISSRIHNNQTCDPTDRERLLRHPDLGYTGKREKQI
jgi:hypothetical protein